MRAEDTARRLQESLAAIAAAPHPPVPWRDGTQLPWNDPAFSERMLRIHLDPTNHMASRSLPVIHRHVGWLLERIAEEVGTVPGRPHVLDVGCGPGLYCHELARRGCQATGIDFAPAPLAYARRLAARSGLDCRFLDLDLWQLPEELPQIVGQVEAVTFWYGEFHSFPPPVARRLLEILARCLAPGGLFLLEYQAYDLFVREDGQEWQACDSSPFSDEPHLWLQEYHWDEERQAEMDVHWIVDAATGALDRYAQCHQAYRDAELVSMLRAAGLHSLRFHSPVTGISERFEFPVLTAVRAQDQEMISTLPVSRS